MHVQVQVRVLEEDDDCHVSDWIHVVKAATDEQEEEDGDGKGENGGERGSTEVDLVVVVVAWPNRGDSQAQDTMREGEEEEEEEEEEGKEGDVQEDVYDAVADIFVHPDGLRHSSVSWHSSASSSSASASTSASSPADALAQELLFDSCRFDTA